MGKLPYIPLYIGDWEQDTNTISLEAEGALVKLTFKLWKSKTKGQVSFSFSQLSILFKKSESDALKIVKELEKNDVLGIDYGQDGTTQIITFSSRRMMREVSKSTTYSENGKKGGRPKKNNEKLKSKSKAKTKLIPDNEYDNDTDIENVVSIEKGGTGEKNETPAMRIISHINLICNKRLKVDNQTFHKHINARLKDGFTEELCFQIIEMNAAKWLGKDMEQYLTPDTLFNKEKGEKYKAQVEEIIAKGLTISQVRGESKPMDAVTLASQAIAIRNARKTNP